MFEMRYIELFAAEAFFCRHPSRDTSSTAYAFLVIMFGNASAMPSGARQAQLDVL